MPYKFQEEYRILAFLGDNEFLYDETVKLFELSNKVRSAIKKGSISFGFTSEAEIMSRVYETIKFLFDNYLISTNTSVFKQYVKNAIILMFEKAEYDLTRDVDTLGILKTIRRNGFYVDYFDYVTICKTFDVEDVKHIERFCDINVIEFKNDLKIERYLKRLCSKLKDLIIVKEH
jgi:hypothetical protein